MHILNKKELKSVIGGATAIEYGLTGTVLDNITSFAEKNDLLDEFEEIFSTLPSPDDIQVKEANVYGGNPESLTIEGVKLIRITFTDNSQLLMTERMVKYVGG
jgi:bacteriocin-like protein